MPPRLGILAGGGDLPVKVAESTSAAGREVYVVAFKGQTDPRTVAGREHLWSRIGAAGEIIEYLRRNDISEIVLAGAIRRPGVLDIRPDARAARFLAKVGRKAFGGDDSLLSALVRALEEEEGFRVLGIQELLANAIARAECYAGEVPDEAAESDIERGFEVVRLIGRADVGQSVVIQQGVVLAVEAIEGTDRMLQRAGELRRDGPGGVLVKARKPEQEERVDLPTIGPTTVSKAADAGLRGIAVEAGGVLLVDEQGICEAAAKAGLFVVGCEPT